MSGFGGVLRGLTQAASGAEQGLANRAELERQARLQLLAQRLQESVIAKNTAEANKAMTPITKNIDPNSPTGVAAYQQKHPPRPATSRGADAGASARARVAASVQGQETRAAAKNALAALDQADAALKLDPNADIYPTGAAIAEGAGNVPIIGGLLKGATGPLGQAQLRPTQQQYQQAMDQFLHNYSALLPKGGRSVAILQNLRNSFTPRAGQESVPVRQAFRQARGNLRKQLEALANGQDAGELPGATPAPLADPAVTPPPTSVTPHRAVVKDWSKYQ